MTPEDLLASRDRLAVVGDVHGMMSELAPIIQRADTDRRHLVLLGDLVDRGPDSIGVLRAIVPRVLDGRATWIRGNHDDKLMRRLAGNPVVVDIELAETLRQLDDAGASFREDLQRAWGMSLLWARWNDHVFVHGAFHPAMAAKSPMSVPHRGAVTALALYGETSGARDGLGHPVRTYAWLDEVPPGTTVVVGHDTCVDHRVQLRSTKLGGKAVFLDTGAGKGGCLTAMILPENVLIPGPSNFRGR